jgi:hypothetical protein
MRAASTKKPSLTSVIVESIFCSVGIFVLFLNLEEYTTGPSEILYCNICNKSVSDRPSHPVKVAPNCGLFGAKLWNVSSGASYR